MEGAGRAIRTSAACSRAFARRSWRTSAQERRCPPFAASDPGSRFRRTRSSISIIAANNQRRMASKKLTLRQKEQLRATRSQLGRNPNVPLVSTPPGPGTDRLAQALAATQMGAGCGPVMADFFAKFTAEQKARRKKYNDISNQRKRDRELLALKTQADLSRQVVGGGREALQPGVDGSASPRAVGAR